MYGRPTRDPRFWWGEDPHEVRRPRPTRPVPPAAWSVSPLRARTQPKHAPEPESSGDGEVLVRGKPLADPLDSPTPLGSDVLPAPTPKPPIPASPARERTDPRVHDALDELEASKDRLRREAKRERELLQGRLVSELLPVLDNLNRSLAVSKDSPDQPLRDGVRMVRDQFDQVLRGFGVEVIEAQGVAFDPAEHEAISMVSVDDPAEHRTVIAVLQPGYRQNGRLLRAAQVSVGDYRPQSSEYDAPMTEHRDGAEA